MTLPAARGGKNRLYTLYEKGIILRMVMPFFISPFTAEGAEDAEKKHPAI